MQPKVSIIILNWNGWEDTLECLRSLEKIDYPNFETILIDNASSSKPPKIADQFPRLNIEQIFNRNNIGFAGGNNEGVTRVMLQKKAEYLLLLNNDTTVEPDFLTKLVEAAQKNEKAGILGPKIYFYNEPKKIWSAGGKISHFFTKGELIGYKEEDEGQYDEKKPVDYISGTCLLIRSEVVREIGLISEDYFLYYEDNDWCLRAKKAGFESIYVPESKIYHKQSKATVEFSFPYIYYHSRNSLLFSFRFGNKLVIPFLSLWIFLKQAVKFIIGYNRNWAKPILFGVFDFWRGRKGKLVGYY